jgi:hypothetical protein
MPIPADELGTFFFVNLFVTLNNICIFAPTTSKQDNEKNRNANRIAGPGYCRQC